MYVTINIPNTFLPVNCGEYFEKHGHGSEKGYILRKRFLTSVKEGLK